MLLFPFIINLPLFIEEHCSYHGDLLSVSDFFEVFKSSLEHAFTQRVYTPDFHLVLVKITERDTNHLPVLS